MPPQSPGELTVELLSKLHERKSFSCGNKALDDYLRRHAIKNTDYGFGRAYVAVKPGDSRIWAFYTLSAAHIDASRFPSLSGAPKYVSVALMGRLAVDSKIQRMGVGELLMAHMFDMTLQASEYIGVHAVFVQAKDERAKNYYLGYGFHSLMDDPLHVFLPVRAIKESAST